MKKILVINAGSSSIKFQLFDEQTLEMNARGLCEGIKVDGNFKIVYGDKKFETKHKFPNFHVALEFVLNYLLENKIIASKEQIVGIGNRIVHGGTKVTESKLITPQVIKDIESFIPIDEIHLVPELDAIRELMQIFDQSKHYVVLDTAFHSDIPAHNYMYGVKTEWLEKYHVRKYGFHGISYQYLTGKMSEILGKKDLNLVICHLGSGASMCAVKHSKSYNTSMGFNPQEGLVMGTRSGDINTFVISYMAEQLNKSCDEVLGMLMKESGLKGLTGYSDLRDVEDRLNDPVIKQGFDVYIKRIVNYLVTYINDLDNKVDAIVFSGGVGENSEIVRKAVIDGIKIAHLEIDEAQNKRRDYQEYMKISTSKSALPIYVVNTNEEVMIAKEVKRLL